MGLVGSADPQAVALGDATNVAARLQSAAEPGDDPRRAGDRRRLVHRFDLGPPVEITVKGREEPVRASQLASREGARAARARDAARRAGARARGAADRRIATSPPGRGRVVLLTGAPGIGKTRLLTELATLGGDRVDLARGPLSLLWRPSRLAVRRGAPRAGSAPRSGSPRSRSGRRRAPGSERSSATTPRPFSSLSPALLRLRLDTHAAPAEGDAEQAFVRWLETLAASKTGHPRRSRTRSGRTRRRASSPRPSSSSRIARPSPWC